MSYLLNPSSMLALTAEPAQERLLPPIVFGGASYPATHVAPGVYVERVTERPTPQEELDRDLDAIWGPT